MLSQVGHFTHDTDSPWPLHFKHSPLWKRRSRSKFAASHYARGTNRVCECKMDVKSTSIPAWHWNGSCFMVTWIVFQKPSLEGRPNTKPGDHGIPNAHNCWFILLYHVWGPTWIKIHRNSIWLRALSHMTSLYTWESVTTVHGFGGALWRPLNTFFWALTFSWSRLSARVWKWPSLYEKDVVVLH
jgi:hypothetical protein